MHDFFSGLPYWKLRPSSDLVNPGTLCLAEPGREYVLYRQTGGTIILDLANLRPEFSLNAQWLDPRTGARKPAGPVAGGAKRSFLCPDARDWVLHLSGAKDSTKATVPAPLLGSAANSSTPEPLRLHPDNPRYFLWKGKPTVLITASEHYGAVLNRDFDYVKYLEGYEVCNGPYERGGLTIAWNDGIIATVVEAELVKLSKVPTLKEIAPYREGLMVGLTAKGGAASSCNGSSMKFWGQKADSSLIFQGFCAPG